MYWNTQPEHGGLATLDPTEIKMFHFNPEQVGAQLTVNYARRSAIGASYQRMHYQNTNNVVFSVTLKSDIRFLAARKVKVGRKLTSTERQEIVDDFFDYQRFLYALAYPRGRQNDVLRRSPPVALLIWPELLAIKVRLTGINFNWTAFAQSGRPVAMEAACTFETVQNYRLTHSLARRKMFLRPEPADKVKDS